MDVKFIRQGDRYAVHPECAEEFVKLPPMRRHALHHKICGTLYAHRGVAPPPGDCELAAKGVAVLRKVLSKKAAAELSRGAGVAIKAMYDGDAAPVTSEKSAHTVICDAALKGRVIEALPKVLDDERTAMLERYYGCHFRIDHLRIYRTFPAPEAVVSFRWHRDGAPMAQVHIMVYLTDSGNKSGSTSFLDLEQTRLAAEAGYHYPDVARRTRDVNKVFAGTRHEPKVNQPKVRAGDAIVFAAPRVLHQGNLPATGFRDVLLLVLLPSLEPWRQDIAGGTDRLFVHDSKGTLLTNPFEAGSPDVEWEARLNTSFSLEPWVRNGELFPPSL